MYYNIIGDTLKTIKDPIEYTWTIKKSKFITTIYPVYSKEDIDTYLKQIKDKYNKATHHCYAYVLDEIVKVSDDAEPSGTAGLPIYQVLKHQNLNHILCVVTRYFGGIKLGSGGLIRAYTKSVTEALKNTILIDDEIKIHWTFKIPYSYQKQVDYLLQNTTILNKQYDDDIIYDILINEEEKNILNDKITLLTKNR